MIGSGPNSEMNDRITGQPSGKGIVRSRLLIEGTVQGVGFRPSVYRLVKEHSLVGFVRNDARGVELEIEGPPSAVLQFVEQLPERIPPMSSITSLKEETCEPLGRGRETTFRILPSEGGGERRVAITPDAHVCEDCLRELMDTADRRFGYPFINCTNCGPRFTIVRSVPYDRPNTTMSEFELCAECRREYEDPLDRRFHAQPVACPACGPRIWLTDPAGGAIEAHDVVAATRERLLRGETLAIKGIGGFHLAVDATNEDAVARLRRRKGRVRGKPFALMCRDLEQTRAIARFSEREKGLLESMARPIVLLDECEKSGLAPSIAPGLSSIGVMLPYSPLHHLLLQHPMPPLVMTSGNSSGEPITVSNEDAIARLGPLCDALVLHDRAIHTGCDDSVVQMAMESESQLIRRSRGEVPRPFDLKNIPLESGILALGGELKAAICLSRRGQLVMGRHLGDLSNEGARRSLRDDVAGLSEILGVEPRLFVHDQHPEYFTTRYAAELEASSSSTISDRVERTSVQHHHAHFASCLAEHDIAPDRAALGVIFDGTGYGPDGTIWGGEILIGSYARYERVAHLRPLPLPGGDAAIRNPFRAALSYLLDAFGDDALELELPAIRRQPSRLLSDLRGMIRAGVNAPRSSGMGRLFDAVATIIGLPGALECPIGYDAQPAMELEAAAGDETVEGVYPIVFEGGDEIDFSPLIRALTKDVLDGKSRCTIAARFHESIVRATVEIVSQLAHREELELVALSGGCFHNRRLLRGVSQGLVSAGLEVLRQRRVPCGDGGLALGQAAIAAVLRGEGNSSH